MARLEKTIKEFQLEISYAKIENARLSEDMLTLENVAAQVHEIQSSFAWYLILRFRRIREKLLPENTRRSRLYQLSLTALSISLAEGLKSLGRTIVSRLKSKRKPKENHEITTLPEGKWHPLSFPLFDEIEVTIIIPVHNQNQHTFNCLQSILKNTDTPYEVIVIDNASTDDTPRLIDAMENVRVIHNQENQGFVTACNQGAGAAIGKNFLFLNNDTEVAEGWLEALLEPLTDEKVGIVGAKLIYPDGRLQEAGNIIWQDGSGWNYGRDDDPSLPQYSYRKEVDYCSGACLLVRKDLWLKLEGFDRRYAPAYYEDTDLCFAARQSGYKVIYQPETCVIHYEGVTAGTDLDSGLKRYQQVNLDKFRDKWREVLAHEQFMDSEALYPARERGFCKRVLIVDHYVPAYDMDSGSLRMFSLVKVFIELGYKVIFWPQNKAYHERYTRELQKIGVEALYGEIDFNKYLKSYGQHIDLVLLSRPYIAIDFIYPAKKFTKARIIYDTVDLHFVREERRARIEEKDASESERYKENQKLAGLRLYIVGSHPTEQIRSLASSHITVTGYVPDVRPYFEKARVFVSPLRYGAGLKGKIGQSMAYGLPIVTTTIGAEGFDLIDGHNVLIADEEEGFADKVIQLYQDRSLWETFSLNSRKLIEKNYTPEVIKQKLKVLLEKRNQG